MNVASVAATPVPSGVCSPARERTLERDGTCFTREALGRLIEAWNASPGGRESPIRGWRGKPKGWRWEQLRDRMVPACGGGAGAGAGAGPSGAMEACWIDRLQPRDPEVIRSLRPSKPSSWKANPYTWLTNHDIEAVMRQYADEPTYHYAFLGVFPIDFEARGAFGTCLYEEICALSLKKLWRQGVRYIGMITNLDRHDEPGSHWTSLFAVIDPGNPAYGAYYYDSVARSPPKEIGAFMDKIEAQCKGLPGGGARPFRKDWNRTQHQYANTECGLFSMGYQIRWIERLREAPDGTRFEDVVHIKIKDADIHRLRDVLFRPAAASAAGGARRRPRAKPKSTDGSGRRGGRRA